MTRLVDNAAWQADDMFDLIRAEQRAQRRFLIRVLVVPVAAFAAGWYLAAFVTLLQVGPGVAPW